MPSVLRTKVAMFAILGVLLIPIVTTNLRGLTHVLTCEEGAATPFTLQVLPDGQATISSSSVLERNPDTGEITGGAGELCGGLSMQLAAGQADTQDGKVEIVVPITNNSDFGWQGSVRLTIGSLNVPVDIGEIAPGETETDVVVLDLGTGTHELDGSLLVGP